MKTLLLIECAPSTIPIPIKQPLSGAKADQAWRLFHCPAAVVAVASDEAAHRQLRILKATQIGLRSDEQ